MKPAKRLLAAAGLAMTLLVGGMSAATADLIANSWSVSAITAGYVPSSPFLDNYSGILSGPLGNEFASATLTIQPPVDIGVGTEASYGDAYGAVDPLGFDNNILSAGARSLVRTGSIVSNAPCGCLDIANTSAGAASATVTNPIPGGATVDLTLHIEGSLTLLKHASDTGLFEVCFDDFDCSLESDMSATVVVVLALADLTSEVEFLDPSSLFLGDVALGFATLGWVEDEGNPGTSKAELFTFGVFDDATITEIGGEDIDTCTADFCKMLFSLDVTITDVQLLGLGEEFEAGLLLLTDAYIGESKEGREAEADFFNTASVTANFLPQAVPAPGSLFLLGLGLLGMGAVRRRRLH